MKDSFIIKFQKLVNKTNLEHIDLVKVGQRYEKIVYTTPPTSSITEFINHWIKNGKSFIDLDRWCLNQGIKNHKGICWEMLRDFLTIPYSYDHQWLYKWNRFARERGYKDIPHLIFMYYRDYTLKEISKKMGISYSGLSKFKFRALNIEKMLKENRIIERRKSYSPHQRRITKMGINSDEKKIEKLRKALEKNNYKSLRSAIAIMRRKGKRWKEIAEFFDIPYSVLRVKLKKSKIDFKKYPRWVKGNIKKGKKGYYTR